MADVKQEGQVKKGVLDGSTQIKEGENIFEMYDNDEQKYKVFLGKLPDGTYALLIAKPDEDIYDAIAD
mgnify:CR=1 FL=1